MPLFALRKKKKVHRHSEVQRKVSVYEKTTTLLGTAFVELSAGETDKARAGFFRAIRTFFAEFMPIHYQFTYEELKEDIAKKHLSDDIKQKISAFLDEAGAAEFRPEPLGRGQLETFFRDFGKIVELLKNELVELPARADAPTPVTGAWSHVVDAIVHPHTDAPQKVRALLAEGQDALERRDVMRGRGIYAEIGQEFIHVPHELKKDLYAQILSYYKKLVALHDTAQG